MSAAPRILCLGGSLRPGSRSLALAHRVRADLLAGGAEVTALLGEELDLPFYRPHAPDQGPAARGLVEAAAACDGAVLVSPSYHGDIPAPLKNALDHVNALADARRPFLDGRPVGCVTVGDGPLGAATTLTALRTAVHALRGWPTPMGVVTWGPVDVDADERVAAQLHVMLGQVLGMAVRGARRRERAGAAAGQPPGR